MLKTWVDQTSDLIASESFKLVKALGKQEKVTKELSLTVLRSYIRLVTLDVLNEFSDMGLNQDDGYDFTKENFLQYKIEIQAQIARSFEDAFLTYAGQHTEYYCLIKLVPEVPTKEIS